MIWTMSEKIEILLNGKREQISTGSSIKSLLKDLGLKEGQVAVEVNRQIIRRDDWPTYSLEPGDSVEIVHFVGGGDRQCQMNW